MQLRSMLSTASQISQRWLKTTPYHQTNLLLGNFFSTQIRHSIATTTQKNVPELPVIDTLAKEIQNRGGMDLSQVGFVCGQHLLNTTPSLFKALIDFGAKPDFIHVVGKTYSTDPNTATLLRTMGIRVHQNSRQHGLGEFTTAYTRDVIRMWEAACATYLPEIEKGRLKNIIILDDGGHVLSQIPDILDLGAQYGLGILGIEQTTSGVKFANQMRYPIISVASSAAKSLVEPAFVADQVCDQIKLKLENIPKNFPGFSDKTAFIGIVGLGNIGLAVLKSLIEVGYKTFVVMDEDYNKVIAVQKKYPDVNINGAHVIHEVLSCVDIVIGCTGKNIITENSLTCFKLRRTPITLVSCSSKDTEFHTLLTFIQAHSKNGITPNPLADLHFQNGFNSPLLIIRGGTPINFHNGPFSIPPEMIQPIRGLKLAAIYQGYRQLQQGNQLNDIYQLDPELQAFILRTWLEQLDPSRPGKLFKDRYTDDEINRMTNTKTLEELSGGLCYPANQGVHDQDVSNPFRFTR